MSICNHDCFNCIFDDCICDDMDATDYESEKLISELLGDPSEVSLSRSLYSYHKNKEKNKEDKK